MSTQLMFRGVGSCRSTIISRKDCRSLVSLVHSSLPSCIGWRQTRFINDGALARAAASNACCVSPFLPVSHGWLHHRCRPPYLFLHVTFHITAGTRESNRKSGLDRRGESVPAAAGPRLQYLPLKAPSASEEITLLHISMQIRCIYTLKRYSRRRKSFNGEICA